MSVEFKSDKLTKYRVLADKIKANLKTEKASIKEETSHGAYFANLPEGIEEKVAKELAKYNSDFVSAAHLAIGETAADMFKKEKTLNKVNAEIGFFGNRDKITATVDRTKQYTNAFAEKEEDKKITKHLVVSSSVQTSGFGLKSIRNEMSKEFKDLFSK